MNSSAAIALRLLPRVARMLPIVLGWLALSGCGRGPYWRPYKAEYLHEAPVAARAALIYEGDVETVVAAGAKIIAELRAKNDKHAQLYGARHGGTHVYLVKSESQTFGKAPKKWTVSSFDQAA